MNPDDCSACRNIISLQRAAAIKTLDRQIAALDERARLVEQNRRPIA